MKVRLEGDRKNATKDLGHANKSRGTSSMRSPPGQDQWPQNHSDRFENNYNGLTGFIFCNSPLHFILA